MRCPNEGIGPRDIGDDFAHLSFRVSEASENVWHRAIDDLEIPAASQLLELDQREIWLDSGCVTVHQKADGTGWGKNRGLSIAIAILRANPKCFVPVFTGGLPERLRACISVDRVRCLEVHTHDAQHGLPILRIPRERAFRSGNFRAGQVGTPAENRCQGSSDGATAVGIVRYPEHHQQRSQIGESQSQGSKIVRVSGDIFRGIGREVDQDFLGQEEDLDRMAIAFDIEGAVRAEELSQVQRSEIAG